VHLPCSLQSLTFGELFCQSLRNVTGVFQWCFRLISGQWAQPGGNIIPQKTYSNRGFQLSAMVRGWSGPVFVGSYTRYLLLES
jgi:hypothetical protein